MSMIDPHIKTQNEAVIYGLTSTDPFVQKEAANGVNDYLRIRAREDGFARRIQPPVNVTPSDLDRQVDTVKPVIVKDMEPNSPGAYSVPLGTVPLDHYIDAPRYRVPFDRIISHRHTADVGNLLTYDLDIRQVFNDLILKDMLHEEDRKYIAACDFIVGNVNTVKTSIAAKSYIQVGALTRATLAYAMEGLPSTNRHLNPATALINNITIWKVAALGRDAIGGDLAEDIFVNGFAERKIMGLDWIITIKTDLVPTNIMYQFAAPKFLGDFFILEDVTMSTKTENYMFEMFGYEFIGGAVKNDAALCKVAFTGSAQTWT
jgi:hypothetical protein